MFRLAFRDNHPAEPEASDGHPQGIRFNDLPFGGGARNCIGFALAQMELTLIIARLAQRLDLTPVAPTVPAPVGMVVNRPTGGAPMHIEPRRRANETVTTGGDHGAVGPAGR